METPIQIRLNEKTVELVKIYAIPSQTVSGAVLLGVDREGKLFVDAGVTLENTDFTTIGLQPSRVYLSNRLISYSSRENEGVREYTDGEASVGKQVQVWLPYYYALRISWMREYLPKVPMNSRKIDA